MQRFNQSPRSAARSRGTPIRSRRSPRSPPRSSILDSPSSGTPPRRGILRQPNASILRQATISPPPLRRQSNRMQELSHEQDDVQLGALYITIRSLVTQSIEYEEAEDEVTGLQGHQDLKDMFAEVGDLGFVYRTRRLLDMLELIQSKQDALAQAMIEEAEENELAEAETDTGSEAESESDSDSDDEPLIRQPSGVTFDSDDEDAEAPPGESFEDFIDRMSRENAARERAREQSDEELSYDSDDLASLMDSDDDIANAGTVDVSATLRF